MACALGAQAKSTASAPLWELGAFTVGLSQPAYPGADQQVNRAIAVPTLIYRGKVLRADRDTAGLRALKTDCFELDIGVAGSFGANADQIDARIGMQDLGTLVELGPRLKWRLGDGPGGGQFRAEFPLRGVFDLNDGAAHRGLAFEPRLVFERQARAGWRYTATVSAIVADNKLARTFYEVSPGEATLSRPAYAASSGLVAWRFSSSFSRSLGRDWRLFGFVRLDTVAGAANAASPLVRQKLGATTGLGIAYTWRRSEASAND